jgi:alkylation response protein AidB-like acyl-CoA dehydrogenase
MAALRHEVRAILADTGAQAAWRALSDPGSSGEGDPRPLYRLLGAHRLLAPAWPRAFGGRFLPATHSAVIVDEMVAAGIPETLHTLSVQICGNFLLAAGSPAQRASVLPMLAAGRRCCAVLYTEQDAGSDLASLATRATPEAGGGWRITGRKLYSVRTNLADLGLVAARTSEEGSHYQGITLFLLPLGARGITVRQLPSLAAESFAEVVLDDVLAGDHDVVGEIGGGWPLIIDALALERTGADYAAKAQAWLALTARVARPPRERWLRDAGPLAARAAAARAMSQRCLSGHDNGLLSPVYAAATKLWCSETARAVAEWSLDALGEAALWPAGDAAAVAAGRLEAAWREAPGLVISASEMMREVIVGAGLAAGEWTQSRPEPLLADLRGAVRAVARGQEPDDRSWDELARLGLPRLDADPAAGGLGLGPQAYAAACGELGACGYDGHALDTLTVISAVAGSAEDTPARDLLPGLLDGSRRGAILVPERPDRPAADPGPGGVILVLPGLSLLADQPDAELSLEVLDSRAPQITCQTRHTSAGAVVSLGLRPGETGREPGSAEGAVWLILQSDWLRLLQGDWLRRAAWLIGAGDACAHAAVQYARGRRQFGKSLLEHQAIAHRLADLVAHGEALWSLLDAETGLAGGPPCAAHGLAGPAGLLAEAGRFAAKSAAEGIHIHGASGLVRGSPAERSYRGVPLAIARGPAPGLLDRLAATPLVAS